MNSRHFIRLKTPTNKNNINFRSDFIDTFSPLKKTNNNFRQSQNYNLLSKKKKYNFIFQRPNIYRSFINASAPFNYSKNPYDKNSYLICFNGGPQKQINSILKREDIDPEYNKEEIAYRNLKQYGFIPNTPIPKLTRNLSHDNFTNKNIKINNNQLNSLKKINYLPKNPFSRNERNLSGFLTSRSLRKSKDGKIVYTLRKYIDENNNEINNNLRYEDVKNEERNNQNIEMRNRFNYSIYGFRPNINKRFHKTQIFDHCKPYLTDEFQEFPD